MRPGLPRESALKSASSLETSRQETCPPGGLYPRVVPETGLKHDWFFPHLNGYPDLGPYESCRRCGVVKPRDAVKAEAATCRGVVKVALR